MTLRSWIVFGTHWLHHHTGWVTVVLFVGKISFLNAIRSNPVQLLLIRIATLSQLVIVNTTGASVVVLVVVLSNYAV